MIEILDKVDSWFLERIDYSEESVPDTIVGTCISITLAEGVRGEKEDIEILGVKLKDTIPVGIQQNSKRITLKFKRVIDFRIVNEIFALSDTCSLPEDKYTGKNFRIYSDSAYVKTVWHSNNWDGNKFYEVLTEWAIIKIFCKHPPECTLL